MKTRRGMSSFSLILLLAVVLAVIITGAAVFREKYYAFISLFVAILSCVPLFYSFERRPTVSKELAVLAVMISISVLGRFAFAWFPLFKPVTAITVIAAMYLGKESGFVIGSLTAVISNFYFGQGPWTPFQMFAWGIIGFAAELLSDRLKKSRVLLCVYGAAAGVFYSLLMDVWTTLWADGTFNLDRYLAAAVLALPATVKYAVSNVVFLLALAGPIGKKLDRIKKKYGLFSS